MFSNLGAFRLANNRLVFEPNNKLPDDPDFYGFPVIETASLTGTVKASPVSVAYDPAVISKPGNEVITTIPEPHYYNDDEPEEKRSSYLWLVLAAIVLVLCAAAFVVYKLYPELYNKYLPAGEPPVVHKTILAPPPEVRRDTIKDTTAKLPPRADTSSQNAALSANTADSIPAAHYEVIVAKFQKSEVRKINASLKLFQAKGIDAKIAEKTPGNMIKITAGTFNTQKAADSLMYLLVKTGKIKKNRNIYIVKVNP